ncbi:MAG TPA: hypothetical protein VGW38_11640 [Chloroflexota bacterium]|nr:hypothetical protein [Chloroflexota bacterium]
MNDEGVRRGVTLVAALILLAAACSNGDDANGDATAPSHSIETSTPTTTSRTTSTIASETASCFLKGLAYGLTLATIERQCALDALLDDIIAGVRLRQSIANSFNELQPGFGMSAEHVVQWGERACQVGSPVIEEMLMRVNATPAERIRMLSPLLDFASDAATQCPGQSGLKDELAYTAWRAVAGPTPTISTVRVILKGQTTSPQLMAELFRGVRHPCDVVGNGVVIGLTEWANVDPPDWTELAFGAMIGAGCEALVEKLS